MPVSWLTSPLNHILNRAYGNPFFCLPGKSLTLNGRHRGAGFISLDHRQRYSGDARSATSSQPTLYEILGVEETATVKEIKAAYIKRTKEKHPDANPGVKDSHRDFIRITEAYGVLRSPVFRQDYDRNLRHSKHRLIQNVDDLADSSSQQRGGYPRHIVIDPADFYKQNYPGSNAEGNKRGYYGVKGVNRQPNHVIVLFCAIIVLFGVILHFAAYRLSVVLRKRDVEKISGKSLVKTTSVAAGQLSRSSSDEVLLEGAIPEVSNLTSTS
ncbi:hypothetical protein BV898_05906 [Hypsibius exemplaris]|uniref:J domain-containing protein n=1 Tax=Hypsibius exemplaris TaxID=2072580 RepID=A0A1W0WY62_HYPEX|nr:hypothetical protein BV898_05906 [Hypsibius exemplaris]